jgi:hypothetical protein
MILTTTAQFVKKLAGYGRYIGHFGSSARRFSPTKSLNINSL